jgi:phage tail sheath protein FI
LPQHYRAPEAIRYASRLRADRYDHSSGGADPDGLDFNERRALSYGALYHPWAVSGAMPPPRSNDTVAAASSLARRIPPASAQGGQRVCPPDGIATGVLAARALLRGPWVAPANEPFRDVVALTPPIETDAWLPLQDAQVNLVRADARGFLTLAADTLADQLEVRPINVRRLLILLRRMALQRGASYVFEPNGDTLRRSVERAFTMLLSDMFRRGAFSGATAAESFQVVTGGGINTDRDRDAGRFLVELRVAPSLPLQFLTLRLAQSGERLTVAEEL